MNLLKITKCIPEKNGIAFNVICCVSNYQLVIDIANSELTLYMQMISRKKVYNYMISSAFIITLTRVRWTLTS